MTVLEPYLLAIHQATTAKHGLPFYHLSVCHCQSPGGRQFRCGADVAAERRRARQEKWMGRKDSGWDEESNYTMAA